MIAESSKAFIFQEFAVKFYFGLSLHIFQHGSSLSLENVCDYWCMHQTGFSSAVAVMPQSKFTELCSSAVVLSQSNLTSCVAQQPLCHKVNLPRCEARQRHLTMTCDIFSTGQTNSLQRWSYWREHLKYVWNVYCDVTNYRQDHHTTETKGNERFPICHGTNYFYFVLTFSLFTSKQLLFLPICLQYLL